MASATSKTSCVTCHKGVGQFKCEGCLQTFCTKHVVEHRQILNQQLDEVIIEHDSFQQKIMEDNHSHKPLLICIDQWEQKSIDKIRQTATEVREKVFQLADTHQKTITQGSQYVKEQIKKAREEDDFFEIDLQNWLSMLEKLKKELNIISLSYTIKEVQTTPLVYDIQISSTKSIETNDKNKLIYTHPQVIAMLPKKKLTHPDDISNLTSKLHPRLQYTNRDGVYVNPTSESPTATWYFYSPNHNRWFWTPYGNYHIWMSVDTLTVKSGCCMDQQPSRINIEIIAYLRRNNPIPPDEIIHAASQTVNRILKL